MFTISGYGEGLSLNALLRRRDFGCVFLAISKAIEFPSIRAYEAL